MTRYIIKNGKILIKNKTLKTDILIENGTIKQIEKDIPVLGDKTEIIDAKGRQVFPGGLDPHVHMELPTPAGISSDDFLSGSKAALAGGTTSIIDFVTPKRGQSFIEAYEERDALARESIIDYKFHVSPTWWGNNSAHEMEFLKKEKGVHSFKCYMAYRDSIGIDDETLLKVMKTAKRIKALVTLHAEIDEIIVANRKRYIREGKTSPLYHPLSRPPKAEIKAVEKAIKMAASVNCPIYFVHVSTDGAIKLIQEAQQYGQEVYAETCPQYLLLDDSVYNQDFEKAAPFVLSPPLRKKEDQEALWEAIAQGNIQTIGTDHCPFNLHGQKDLGKDDFTKIANGAGGVEHRMSLLYTYGVLEGRISFQQFIDITSKNAAQIFQFDGKGELKIGMDADLVIWGENKELVISAKTHHQRCDSNIYEGMEVKGTVERVFSKHITHA
ncbi:MAG: dihydropyrimidinase [Chlorobi bacterium]|nr:dihydropyrimidinase [Chlorobiota bacterium]